MSTTVSWDHAGAGGQWLPSDLHLQSSDSGAVVAGFIGQAGRWQLACMTKPDYSTIGAKLFGQRILPPHQATLFLIVWLCGGTKDLHATKAHIQALNEARMAARTEFYDFNSQPTDVSRSPGVKRQNRHKQSEELYGKCATVTTPTS